MPVDHRRINGPEDTVPYHLFSKLNIQSLSSKFADVYKNGKRKDDRKSNEHRKMFTDVGVVSQAKGSAYVEQGETKVIVAVYDPREIPNRTEYSLIGEIYCEFKYATFSCQKRRLHQLDAEEKHYSTILKQALESTVCRCEFPNFQVDVYALVLHNDGSALSAAITAAGMAMANGGVPMYDIITSATLGVQNNVKLLDVSLEEEKLCATNISKEYTNGTVTLSYVNSHEQVSQIFVNGHLSLEDVTESVQMLTQACKDIVPLVQKKLVKSVYNKIQEEQ